MQHCIQSTETCFYICSFPDPDKLFELVCDASGFDPGAVLVQEGHPLGHNSRKMTAAERSYVVTEPELLATVKLCVSSGATCCLVSTSIWSLIISQTLSCKLSQPNPGVKPVGVRHLQHFNHNWVHRSGRHNVADPLSHNPTFKQLKALLAITARSPTHKRSVQDMHSDPASDIAASQADQKPRKTATTPATGANTVPVSMTTGSPLLTLLPPLSL